MASSRRETRSGTPYAEVFFRGLVLAGAAAAVSGVITAVLDPVRSGLNPIILLLGFCMGFCVGLPAGGAALVLHKLTARFSPLIRASAAALGAALGVLILPALLWGPGFALGFWPWQWAPLLAAAAAVPLTRPLRTTRPSAYHPPGA